MEDKNVLAHNLEEAERVMRAQLGDFVPEVLLILGSGLNPLAEEIENPIRIPYGTVPHMEVSTAAGHVGCFVAGTFGARRVLVMQGRLHGYEGHTAVEVAFPVWLAARLGVRVLITTNAAGAINESYRPGDFCMVADHLNFTGRNPLANVGAANLAERFVSMTNAYDPILRQVALDVAAREGVTLHEGIFLSVLGPSFETPAEIRTFRLWGADTVAMSVVEEVIAARHVGMRVLGISLVSNMAAGIEGSSPSGDEVLEVARTREAHFSALIRGVLASEAIG